MHLAACPLSRIVGSAYFSFAARPLSRNVESSFFPFEKKKSRRIGVKGPSVLHRTGRDLPFDIFIRDDLQRKPARRFQQTRGNTMAKLSAGSEVSNTQVVLKDHVFGRLTEDDLEVKTGTKKLTLDEGKPQVIVKVLYLSCDPYMRGRMKPDLDSYIPPFQPSQPIGGYGAGKVVLSSDPKFSEGDYVAGIMNWEEYSVGFMLNKVDASAVPLSYWVGALGMPGWTAYAGFFRVCKPKAGETIYISAASGAVGQFVGQFAKIAGCHVVGSAGSQQKIDILKNKFKYDEAFNYKEADDLTATIKKFCPNGIDMYFENVGGKMLDAVLPNLNPHSRIAVCGMVSQYNLDEKDGIKNLSYIVKRRVSMTGFLVSDHLDIIPEFNEKMLGWFKEKKIEYVEDVTEGLAAGPKAFVGMMEGRNVGKACVKVADD